MALDQQRLQALLDDTAGRLGIVGAQLAIFDGEEQAEFACGTANVETGLPVTTDTLFQIGSTTKVYTAALVMQLVDEGKVDLDKPVRSYLPDLRLANRDATASVTCRHLLTMSSGIDNGPYSDHGPGDDCIERYVASLAEIPLQFQPGEGFGYSNASTTVAGLLVERMTGLCWDDALRQRLVKPAGLAHTASRLRQLIFRRVAVGHVVPEEGDPRVIHRWGLPRAHGPAGSTLCATAGDLVLFARAFLAQGQTIDGDKILSAAAVKEMQRPQVDVPTKLMAEKWGVGPYAKVWDGNLVHGHSGTSTGGSSVLLWVPESNAAIATVSNVPPKGYPLADAAFAQIFPSVFGIRKPPRPVPDRGLAIDAERLAGTYEAYAVIYVVEAVDGRLMLTKRSEQGMDLGGEPEVLETELLPLDGNRFLFAEERASGGRGWDAAFVGDIGGRATHFIDGVFAARRVD